jgi:hypothetical protein
VRSGGFGGVNLLAQLQLVCRASGRVPIPVVLPVLRIDQAFDRPGKLPRPKLAARVRPSVGELNWKVRALASPCESSVESGSP